MFPFACDYEVPRDRQARVIISTDTKNEADDQYAIAYALMSPSLDVRGLVATHFVRKQAEGSMEASYEEACKVLELMGLAGYTPVYKGSPAPLRDEATPWDTPGARFLIEECHREDPRPLYIVNIGAITDMASAYLLDPTIAERVEAVVWLGGGPHPDGGYEFNLSCDIAAFNVILDSPLPLWQLPADSSCVLWVGTGELAYRVKPCGELGKYLFEQLVAYNHRVANSQEFRILWDIGAVGVVINEQIYAHEQLPAPRVQEDMRYEHPAGRRDIRVYKRIEPRYVLDDLFCKLAMNYGPGPVHYQPAQDR